MPGCTLLRVLREGDQAGVQFGNQRVWGPPVEHLWESVEVRGRKCAGGGRRWGRREGESEGGAAGEWEGGRDGGWLPAGTNGPQEKLAVLRHASKPPPTDQKKQVLRHASAVGAWLHEKEGGRR